MKEYQKINYSDRFFGSTRIAIKVGANAAIVHAKLAYFINENKKAERNFIDGQYWTYITCEELHQAMPYLSTKQIRLAIQKLKENNLVTTGNYNKWRTDKTTWYAIPDKVMQLGYPSKK